MLAAQFRDARKDILMQYSFTAANSDLLRGQTAIRTCLEAEGVATNFIIFVLEGSYILLRISSNLMVALKHDSNNCRQESSVNHGRHCIAV